MAYHDGYAGGYSGLLIPISSTADTVIVTRLRNREPVEQYPADNIVYSYRLNRPGSIRFSLAVDHPKTVRANIDTGTHEAVVVRNRAIVWAGPVRTIAETGESIEVAGEGLMSYLRGWHITSTITHVGVDQFTIARSFLDHHQSKSGGNFEIDTSASTLSGKTRDRTYEGFELKSIFDALVELSEVDDGFDFNINPDTRALDLFYPKRGIRRNDIVFDERNIRAFSRQRDGTSQASQVWAVGEGEGADMLLRSQQSSTAVAAFGLLQRVITHKDVSVVATLDGHATDALDSYATIPNLIAIRVGTTDPQLFSYNLGDEVRVKWPSPFDPVDEFQRLIGMDVIWESGEESAVLYLEPL